MLPKLTRAMKALVAAVEEGSDAAILAAAKTTVKWYKLCWSSRR